MPTTRRAPRRRGRRPRSPEEIVCAEIARNAGKYVAVNREWTRVVAVGRTLLETHRKAIQAGFPDAPVFLAAKDYSGVFF